MSDWSSDVCSSDLTFLASVSCIVLAGATPVFADSDRDSQTITADTIAAVITPRTRAIICVHLAGWPCDMDPIMALADSHGLWVVEDCAQAHGARYKNRPVGSIGHIGAWSFCQEDRKSVVWGKSVSVRVDLGGRRIIKKKNDIYCRP